MFHVWYAGVAILTLIVISVILIILMYGDRICTRVKTQIDHAANAETFRNRRAIREYQERPIMELELLQGQKSSSYAREVEV